MKMLFGKKTIIGAGIALMAASSAHGEYTLKITRGNYPEGVKIENISGCIPEEYAYKKVAIDRGWTAGDYGTKLNVCLSPSFMKQGEVCENALILPLLKIEEGEWLSWEGCAVYPLFKENYTIECREMGRDMWVTLAEFEETDNSWERHMVDLAVYSGKEIEIRFVCRSHHGYMLALSNISVKTPVGVELQCDNLTPKFFAADELEDGMALTRFILTNTGADIAGCVIGLTDGDDLQAKTEDTGKWKTGESREFMLRLPVALNERKDYKITIEGEDFGRQTVAESFAYCTSFRRYLLVDKGTGMWCNACPSATLAMEELIREYGDAVIGVETHDNDLLANEINFSWLKFYSIPCMMLNRVKKSIGGNPENFGGYICEPTEMEITVDELTRDEGSAMKAKATIRTSDYFMPSDTISYRVGYVLTKNINGNLNNQYYQKNIYNVNSYKQYYYLPSRMLYTLCNFPNTSLISPTATMEENVSFTGIDGSLPQKLEAGASYEFSWDIPLPVGYEDFDGVRLVAYILETQTGIVVNSTAIDMGESSGVEVVETKDCRVADDDIYDVAGQKVMGKPKRGIYIVNGRKVIYQ